MKEHDRFQTFKTADEANERVIELEKMVEEARVTIWDLRTKNRMLFQGYYSISSLIATAIMGLATAYHPASGAFFFLSQLVTVILFHIVIKHHVQSKIKDFYYHSPLRCRYTYLIDKEDE